MFGMLRPMGWQGTYKLLYGREIVHGNDGDILAGNIGIMAYAAALNIFPGAGSFTHDRVESPKN